MAVPFAQGFGGSGLPITVPREQVYVVDQIFRYSVANNFNLFVPGGPPSPTRQGLVMDTLWYIDQDSGEWINSLATDPADMQRRRRIADSQVPLT